MGWFGSWSGLSAPVISCMSALPVEVTRSETYMGLPSKVPSQEPVRVFILSKDFCASVCAKVTVESDIKTANNIKRGDFMFNSPLYLGASFGQFAATALVFCQEWRSIFPFPLSLNL